MIATTCPWCLEQIEFQSLATTLPLKCDKCGEEFYLNVALSPNMRRDATDEFSAASSAVGNNIWRASLAIYDDRSNELSSGTLIRIDGRILVSTCGHAILGKGASTLRCAPKNAGEAGTTQVAPETIVAKSFKNGEPDVGLLSLSDNAPDLLGIDPISLDRIVDAGTGNPRGIGWICGTPAEWTIPGYPRSDIIGVASKVFPFFPIAVELWDKVEHHFVRQLDTSRDVVSHHDRFAAGRNPKPHKDLPDSPKEHGMSGGGLWQVDSGAIRSKVWNPDNVKLFAIQSCRAKKDYPLLRAVQIAWWLRLLADTYPEYEADVVSQFPRVSSLKF